MRTPPEGNTNLSATSQNDSIALVLRKQADWCRRLDCEVYATILESAAEDADVGGIVSELLGPYATDPLESALALRLLARVHRIALRGDAPSLAEIYPSCGGNGDASNAWAAFKDTLNEYFEELQIGAACGVQTNEVNRCAALVGGFLAIAERTKLPLRIFEVGASAGLNLRWDQFRYAADAWQWGPAEARLVLRGNFLTAPPAVTLPVSVVERRGCDLAPIDPTTEKGRQTLISFVWPNQLGRIDQLEQACDVAREVPAKVDRDDALSWLESAPVRPVPGTATVVFHSVVMQYLSDADRKTFKARIAELASQATASAPFAHLFMEPPQFGARLSLWPGFTSALLAESTPHGREIRWTKSALTTL